MGDDERRGNDADASGLSNGGLSDGGLSEGLSDADVDARWAELVESLRTDPGRATNLWNHFGQDLAHAPERRIGP